MTPKNRPTLKLSLTRTARSLTYTSSPKFLFILALALTLAACSSAPSEPTSTPAPTLTPTPSGPQELTICTAEEPQSLYLYGDSSAAAQSIRQAIYDGPFDRQKGQSQGTIFAQQPSLENGGLHIEALPVEIGDLVVDADGVVSPLFEGLSVRPSACRSGDCAIAYAGDELLMDQMIVTYDLVPNLAWADGTPLTAADSLYSFRVATDPATPGEKSRINHTFSYQALDQDSIEWRGLPGYLDADYLRNFWSPLPEHILGNNSPEELLSLEAANRTPLGWGAYSVEAWNAGESITLARNPYYFRATEALPNFQKVTIRFIGNAPQSNIQAFQDGACDVLLPSTGIETDFARINALESADEAQIHFGESPAWLHLDFGIQPLVYDDGINPYNERPDFFSNPALRQAFAQCVDRETLLDQFAFGQGQIPNSYLAPGHPLYSADAQSYAFDPVAASAILEASGWLAGEDGVRVAQNVENILPGTRLEMRLHVTDDADSLALAASIKNSLDDCGIATNIISGSPEFIYAPGPNAPLFGRNFDLAIFAWPLSEEPACYLYQSDFIPGPDPEINAYAWGGWNLTGWANPQFDAACQAAMNALPGESSYAVQHALAQEIFASEVPALPLYIPQQIAMTRPDFCGFDFSTGDPLSAIESFGFAEWCP